MQSSFKYAIFDNDGTLLDSMKYWRLGTLEYIMANNMALPEEMTIRELLTSSSRESTTRLAEQRGLTFEEILPELEERMDRHYLHDVHPKPGCLEFLEALKADGAKLCVATAARGEPCRRALEKLDMLKYFDFVTDSYEIGVYKSKPEFFQAVAERMGTTAENCWVFEDAVYAMRGAKLAGAKVCAIEDYTALRNREEIMKIADRYVKDYRELM